MTSNVKPKFAVPVTMPPRWVRIGGGYVAPGVHRSLAPRLEHRAEPYGGTLAAWHRTVTASDASRHGYELEDDDRFDLGGHQTVYRRFGHVASGVPVLTDQWLWLVDGVGHQLLGTVAEAEYEEYCEVFESVAETFDPGTGRKSRSA